MGAIAVAIGVLPAQALLLDVGALGFAADIPDRIGSTVGFSERVPAGDECNSLVVIHRHAAERLPDVACRSDRIRLSIGPFAIHINQTHLNRAVSIIELTIS